VGYNPYIVVPFATWAVAQISKFAIAAIKGRIDFRYLYASGGMPSVHSAVVCSLAVTALLVDGMKSPIFGFTVIFAAIVMYDSFGVRRAAGEQAAAINMLIESLDHSKVKLSQPDLHLREILGHQPKEVTVGAIVGVVLAGFFNYGRLGAFGVWLQDVPTHREWMAYSAVFLVILIAGIAARIGLRMRYRTSKAIKLLARRILAATETIGWLGIVSVVLIYERATYLSWRLWALMILAIGLAWAVWIVGVSWRAVPAALADEATEARKRKWLNWGQDKRKRR